MADIVTAPVRAPIDDRGRAALLGPHQTLSAVDVLAAGQVVASAPATVGKVRADRSRFQRRTGQVVIPDPGWYDELANSRLSVFGSEVRLWRGIGRPLDVPQWACVGTLLVRDLSVSRPFDGVMIDGADRASLVSDTNFLEPRTVSGSVFGLITQLLEEAVPYAPLRIDPRVSNADVPWVTWDKGDRSRERALADLAQSRGAELYVDAMGTFVLQPIPDTANGADWTIGDGVLTKLGRGHSRDGIRNGVMAVSSASDLLEPIASPYVVDSDPYSPTYWGPANDPIPRASLSTGNVFGHIGMVYASPLLRSVDSATLAAASILRDQLGLVRSVSFATVPDPSREVGSVGRIGGTSYIIDTLDVGLGADQTMTGATRTTTYRTA